jgi:hypothetical protein
METDEIVATAGLLAVVVIVLLFVFLLVQVAG